jgi:hypothetical protein
MSKHRMELLSDAVFPDQDRTSPSRVFITNDASAVLCALLELDELDLRRYPIENRKAVFAKLLLGAFEHRSQ